jgi:hypothetical protein
MKLRSNLSFGTLRLLAIFGLVCTGIVALAQPMPPGVHRGPGGPGGPTLGMLLSPALDLTSDQETAIKAVLDSHETALETDRTAAANAETNLETYLNSGGSSDIATYVAAIATAVSALRTEEAAVFVGVYALLTDAQKATLASLGNNLPRLLMMRVQPGQSRQEPRGDSEG